MRVLVVGNGAREHAIAWKFSKSNRISGLFVAPGNAGTAGIATNVSELTPDNIDGIVGWATNHRIGLVFVGPEKPLAAGLVDALNEVGIATVGPHAAAAQLESSKHFSKGFMNRHGIPTASHHSFAAPDDAERYLRSNPGPVVIKKSGLAAGKGVLETEEIDRQVAFAREVIAGGDTVVVEERLTGGEVSVFLLLDGDSYQQLPACTDYKKAGVGGAGPNTGGMGALCPVPWLTPADHQAITRTIVEPTLSGLQTDRLMYKGVLYIGLMMTPDGPRVLEYNVRLGDPETQVLLPIIATDIVNCCEAIIRGELSSLSIAISQRVAIGVVLAAAGYPGEYEKGIPVDALPDSESADTALFHAATVSQDGAVLTNGGRCFTAVGLGSDLLDARRRAYDLARSVAFSGSWYRPDIGGGIFGA